MSRVLVAGVDTSTQSTKVRVTDAETGEMVRFGQAKHPDGTSVNPDAWWQAFQEAAEQAGGLDDVAALAVGGQQHGMVLLDDHGRVIRDALLWNDTRSATNADYSPVGLLSAPWAQYGTLAEAYPASTLAVDDTQGLLYRPYKEDPAFGPVSRTDLFGARRMALVGDELMLFQTVVLEGSETTRLSGVVRGYMNTPVQAHASGAAIWVFRNPGEGNTVQGLPIGTHNIKLRPVSGDEVLGADRVDRLSLAVTGKAMVPWPVAGLRAVRTGDSVAVSWSPVDVAFGGAGTRTENENEPVPAGFSGDFVLTAAGTEHVVNGTSITLTRSGRFALSVTARQLGYVSPAAYVTVESQDGEYVA